MEEVRKSSAPFCTCTDHKCPLNPVNHDKGCNPCIVKNLKQGEIPSCFFHKAGIHEHLDSYTMESFANEVMKRKKH